MSAVAGCPADWRFVTAEKRLSAGPSVAPVVNIHIASSGTTGSNSSVRIFARIVHIARGCGRRRPPSQQRVLPLHSIPPVRLGDDAVAFAPAFAGCY